MTYSNVEILSGVLVVACLLLLWRNRAKVVSLVKGGSEQAGLVIRDGYTALPSAGKFHHDGFSSYATHSGYFTENLEDKGLNDLHTTPAPPSTDMSTPDVDVNAGLWLPEAGINSHEFSADEEAEMYNNVFERHSNRVKQAGESLSGALLHYVDYGANMLATRPVTM